MYASPDLGFFKWKGGTHHVLLVYGAFLRVLLGVKLGETCHGIFTCKLVLFFVHTIYWGSQTPQKILLEDLVQGRKGFQWSLPDSYFPVLTILSTALCLLVMIPIKSLKFAFVFGGRKMCIILFTVGPARCLLMPSTVTGPLLYKSALLSFFFFSFLIILFPFLHLKSVTK